MLRPLGKSFLFEFASDTAGGLLIEKNLGKILLTAEVLNQGKFARWGKVLAVGDMVTDFVPGQWVLIEPLQWTTEIRFQDRKYWKSDETKVLAVTDHERDTFAY